MFLLARIPRRWRDEGTAIRSALRARLRRLLLAGLLGLYSGNVLLWGWRCSLIQGSGRHAIFQQCRISRRGGRVALMLLRLFNCLRMQGSKEDRSNGNYN